MNMECNLTNNFEQCPSEVLETSRIIALMDSDEYDQFIRFNLESVDLEGQVPLVDVDLIGSDYINLLKEAEPEILITAWRTPYLSGDLLTQVPSLKYIAHCCGTVKLFMSRGILEKGLLVTNWGTVAARDVAEHCLMQTLACLRRVSKFQKRMHFEKSWREKDVYVSSLFSKRVGIYGTGRTAQEYARLLRVFDCAVSMYSESIPHDLAEDIHITSGLAELFSDNDIIVVLESANDRTYHSVDIEKLSLIKSQGVFINSARGMIVNQKDLEKIALNNEIEIALDVFDPEPLCENSLLRGCENVLLTPHVAGPTKENRFFCGLHCLQNVKNYLEGKDVAAIVKLEDYDRMSSD